MPNVFQIKSGGFNGRESYPKEGYLCKISTKLLIVSRINFKLFSPLVEHQHIDQTGNTTVMYTQKCETLNLFKERNISTNL